MTLEEVLIEKQYYKYTFMKEGVIDPPVRVLGEAYVIENQKEFSDLSFIRYAQGEVYFHNKDFESAIFKWENINNELEPWAKKIWQMPTLNLGYFLLLKIYTIQLLQTPSPHYRVISQTF